MIASGDWLTPRLNGYRYFEKPPLQYWATATAYKAFGVGEWTTRLWPALTGFAGVLLVFFAGRRIFGPEAGLYAAAALAGSLLYVVMGHFATLDMGVSVFLSLAVFAFLLAQLDATGPPARRYWMLAAWAAAALAVLSKGLIGIVLPTAAVAAYVLWQRDWGLLRRLHVVAGLSVFLLIAAPWFVAVSLANPEFARFFFVHEHFERFFTQVHERHQPAWYFLLVLAVGITPWWASLGAALWGAARAQEEARFQPLRFLLVWCAVVFAFFSASESKLAPYILPIFPALALLIGWQLTQAPRALLAAQAGLAAAIGAALLVAVPNLSQLPLSRVPAELFADYLPWLLSAAAALFVFALAAGSLAWSQRRLASIVALAVAGLAFGQIALIGRETLSPAYSTYHVVERARPALDSNAPFYVVDAYDHTLPFYLGRTITMVGYKDELAAAIAWEPEKFVADVPVFVERWRGERAAFAAFRPAAFDDIRRRYDLEAQVIAEDPRLVIVRKP